MKSLKIFSWNVNGLRAIYKKGFLEWLKKENPDILCLQETKASEDQLPFDIKLIDGYSSYFSDAEKKGYSGVAVYTKLKPIKVNRSLGKETFDREGRVLELDYGDFVLLNVYFPNGKASSERLRYKMDFYEKFLKHIIELRKQNKNVIFCGDVNTAHKEIDLARPKDNENVSGFLPQERAWIDDVVSNGFVDIYRCFKQKEGEYTWWSQRTRARDRNIGWRIDYFFVNSEFCKNVVEAKIHGEVLGSDHCPISIILENLAI
jgi:exodeoxyribonuclease-3